jgi:predicted nuclease of predicted toxin-antitoxin system
MKILINMNLSPEWVSVLKDAGHEAVHWSHIGEPSASDSKILSWNIWNIREPNFILY